MQNRRCFNCMEETAGYPCPHCGYSPEEQPQREDALPAGTVLKGRCFVGRNLGRTRFGMTYHACDLNTGYKFLLKEFFPAGYASRIVGDNGIAWKDNRDGRDLRDYGTEAVLKEAASPRTGEPVRYLGAFRENNTSYVVMDLPRGDPMNTYLDRRPPMSWMPMAPLSDPQAISMQIPVQSPAPVYTQAPAPEPRQSAAPVRKSAAAPAPAAPARPAPAAEKTASSRRLSDTLHGVAFGIIYTLSLILAAAIGAGLALLIVR